MEGRSEEPMNFSPLLGTGSVKIFHIPALWTLMDVSLAHTRDSLSWHFLLGLVIIHNQLMSLLYLQHYWAAMHAKSSKSIYVHPRCGRCCCTGWSPLTFVPALTSQFLPLQATCFQWSSAIPNSPNIRTQVSVSVCVCVAGGSLIQTQPMKVPNLMLSCN